MVGNTQRWAELVMVFSGGVLAVWKVGKTQGRWAVWRKEGTWSRGLPRHLLNTAMPTSSAGFSAAAQNIDS